jgi:triphosphoribosyl-dephospho-CoA synthase
LQQTPDKSLAEHVASCLQLAILLEVNAPKPGNIHKNANFHKTNYEHYLASAVAMAPSLKTAAAQGILAAEGKIALAKIDIGNIIKDAVERVDSWQHGGNTLLGSAILLSPIAAAAGKTLRENDEAFDATTLRKNLHSIVTAATPEDAVAVYEAIEIAKPGGLNMAPKFDATKPVSKREILQTHTTLFDVFKISAGYDSIASEWVSNYTITFDVGYSNLRKELKTRSNINEAVVQTFLKILSEVPDTLIARKNGKEKAEEISRRAERVLDLGGLDTAQGKQALKTLDENLRDSENKLNPGTTADLITASLALLVLSGYRP